MNWRFYITDPTERALRRCHGSMDEGTGYGVGWDYGDGDGYGMGGGGYSIARGDGSGHGDYGNTWGDGYSTAEWK
jgi:hypothetical protein